jgi:hypothetical protein
VKTRFPLAIFGVTDMNRKFHCLGMAMISSECETDYCRLLEDFKAVVAEHLDIDLKPDYVMTDGDAAMRNATRAVWNTGDWKHLMCFFHVQTNVKRHLGGNAASQRDGRVETIQVDTILQFCVVSATYITPPMKPCSSYD